MDSRFEIIKRKFQTIIILINLLSFIIMTSYVNNKKRKYIEYTNLSKLLSNSYIIIILLLMLINSIFPNLTCKMFNDNLAILTKSKGKIVIILLIGVLYWTSDNFPHVIFGIINFISFFILVLCEFIFDCKIIKKNPEKKELIGNSVNNNIIIKNNNIINKNLSMNNQNINSLKDEKNGSNVPFFENIKSNDNYFDNIKQANLKAQEQNLNK